MRLTRRGVAALWVGLFLLAASVSCTVTAMTDRSSTVGAHCAEDEFMHRVPHPDGELRCVHVDEIVTSYHK